MLTALASSGLDVRYTVVSGPAKVSGDQLTLTGTGPVVIVAEQPGNAQFLPALSQALVTIVEPDEPPAINLPPPGTDGRLVLEVTAGLGEEVIVETTTDLSAWVETQRVTGEGRGAPVRITIIPQVGGDARFWRLRRP
jgi:hypothetical protein